MSSFYKLVPTFVALLSATLPYTVAAPTVEPRQGNNVEVLSPPLNVRILHQFPNGTFAENIAVRPNGELLITVLSTPELYTLDPLASQPTLRLVHRFDDYRGLMGIDEIAPDVFAVAVGNIDLETGESGAGSWSMWKVDFRTQEQEPNSNGASSAAAVISLIAELPQANRLNGVTNIPDPTLTGLETENLLVGDVSLGLIYGINSSTGQSFTAINNTFTQTGDDPFFAQVGVNGIYTLGEDLYFINTGKDFFGRMPITANGTAAGEGEILLRAPNATYRFDDFTVRGDTAYLVTGLANSIARVTPLDGTASLEVVAGNLNSSAILTPTSCELGRTDRDRDTLYVVVAGNYSAPSGAVLAVDL